MTYTLNLRFKNGIILPTGQWYAPSEVNYLHILHILHILQTLHSLHSLHSLLGLLGLHISVNSFNLQQVRDLVSESVTELVTWVDYDLTYVDPIKKTQI